MGNSSKKPNQATEEKKDETQAQTVENQQTDAPQTVTQAAASDAETGKGDGAPTDTPAAGGADDKDSKTKDKKVKLTLRHKSHTQHYYRCGLMLTKVFAEYEVSEEAVAKIKADKWIEIKGSK